MKLPILAFLVVATYLPIPSASTSPRWAIMAIGAALLLWGTRVRMTRAHWAGVAFIGYAALSILWSPSPQDTIGEVWHLVILGAVFCIGSESDKLDKVYVAAALGLLPSIIVSILQLYGYHPVLTASPLPTGLFLNKNTMAEIGAVVLVGLFVTRQWKWIPIPLLAACLPMAREVLLSLGFVAILWIWGMGKRRSAVSLVSLFVAALLIADLWLPHRIADLDARLVIWQVTAENLKLFGWGYGSFGAILPVFEYAHNEPLQLLFECGAGVIPVGLLLAFMLHNKIKQETIVLVCILASCLVSFPLHLPATAFFAALLAGRLSRGGADLVRV